MIRRSALLTATVIGAVVFAGSTPAHAADANAIKRAIIVTVLNNLGVEPTANLINDLISELPIDALDSDLVEQVGESLDNSDDPTMIISQTVDSDGDGIPNADATVDDETDDNESESGGTSGSSGNSGTSGNTGGSSTNNNDEDDEEEPDDEDEPEDEDEDDGDEEDN